MRLALIFDKLRDDTVGVYFERACRSVGITTDHFWLRDGNAIPDGYDLYLRIDHGDYRHDLPDRLHPKVFYAIDSHLPHSWRDIRRAAPRYDVVFCAHRHATETLRDAVWLPIACDPELHGRVNLPQRWDVAFIGTEGGVPRKFYLQALRERYPDHFLGHAPHTEIGRLYSQARIGFNYSIRDDVNMRALEVLAGGALLITNRLTHDDFEQLGFRDPQHLVYYRQPAELFAIMDHFLKHEAERRAIADAGRALALERHTYVHRMHTILRVTAERLGKKVSDTLRKSV